MIKEKMYSFNIVTPKRLNNKKIIVKAINQKEGRKKILDWLFKINKRIVRVYEVKGGAHDI
jgi:hypothetical protein